MSKYVAINGLCSTTKKPIGIQFEKQGNNFVAVGCYLVSSTDGASGNTEELTGRVLERNFKCKRCGNTSVIACACNTVICLQAKAPQVVCPNCGNTYNINWVDDIDLVSESRINGTKQ